MMDLAKAIKLLKEVIIELEKGQKKRLTVADGMTRAEWWEYQEKLSKELGIDHIKADKQQIKECFEEMDITKK